MSAPRVVRVTRVSRGEVSREPFISSLSEAAEQLRADSRALIAVSRALRSQAADLRRLAALSRLASRPLQARFDRVRAVGPPAPEAPDAAEPHRSTRGASTRVAAEPRMTKGIW